MSGPSRTFALAFVGGPYDGVDAFVWGDFDPPQLPPELLYLGVCPGDGTCYGSKVECLRLADGRSHVSYWSPAEGEEARPPNCVPYRRHDVSEEEPLSATYVHGDFDALGEWRDAVELSTPELVTAMDVSEAWAEAERDRRRVCPRSAVAFPGWSGS